MNRSLAALLLFSACFPGTELADGGMIDPDAGEAIDAGTHDAGACTYDDNTRTAEATFYSGASNGQCTAPFTFTHYAALPTMTYLALCGACIEVTGPKGTTTVTVTDQCPECEGDNVDLSDTAFAEIADPNDGKVAVTWVSVPCDVTGKATVDFQGSNAYYLKVRVLNVRHALASVTLQPANLTAPLTTVRTTDDFWEASGINAPYEFPLTVRVTDVFGQTITLTAQSLINDEAIDGGAQFPAYCAP